MRKVLATLTSAVLVTAASAVIQFSASTPAMALDNGLAKTPPMGFNDWNAFGCNVDEQLIEQTADAMVANGMKAAGYQYVNIDDCWALPQRDANGNLQPDPEKFPHGIRAVADYVHADGLKLGLYEDSGTRTCSRSHGFPGSLGHEYDDALQFAKWGVDYLKYDDCNQPADQQNVQATIKRYTTMRDALAEATRKTGQSIVYSICEKTDFGVPNSAWPEVGNLWRTTGDIHDQYSRMVSLFHTNVKLADLAGPGAWNDPDMLEIGNGGQTDAEYRSEFSLWAEMAAPLIAGTDLRNASPQTLAIYLNSDVIAVDQDPLGKQGVPVSSDNGHWVLTKPLANGDRAITLFNETDTRATISTTVGAIGFHPAEDPPAYTLKDLWSKKVTETAGKISASVAPHSTVMYRVSPTHTPQAVPPHTTVGMSGLADTVRPGRDQTVTVSFTDNGRLPATDVTLSLDAPKGWTLEPTSPTGFPAVPTGESVQATWKLTEAAPDTPFGGYRVTASSSYRWGTGGSDSSPPVSRSVSATTTVRPPYRTFSSTTAQFGQAGDSLGIRAAGHDVYGGSNDYGAIYLPNAEQDGTVAQVRVTSQQRTDEWAKAGIMVRNDITNSGGSPGYLILAVTPGHGYVLQWDANGDGHLDHNSAPNDEGTGTTIYPSWLRLTRHGESFTGAYSTDGSTWHDVATVDVPSAADSQDVGLFATSHADGTTGEVDFADLSVSPPSGILETPGTQVAYPGQASPVSATFYDHGSDAISNARVTLSGPAGWSIDPSGEVSLSDVASGGHADASWTVTAPADAPSGAARFTATATYTVGGRQETTTADVPVVVPSADLSSAYDNVGITDDDNTDVGDIDGAGSSLSATALADAGVTPGSVVTYHGLHFVWPTAAPGTKDNVLAAGQSLQLSGNGDTLGFLLTGTYGPASGTGTIAYTDGSTQQFTLAAPDWYSSPPSGSDVAFTMAYRNRGGNRQQTHQITMFYAGIALQSGKTVRGVTLPDVSDTATSGKPAMHIFSVAVG